jgi:hypothetical protein
MSILQKILQKYIDVEHKEKEKKDIVIQIIKNKTGVDVIHSQIECKDTTCYIYVSSIKKTLILKNKEDIVKELQEIYINNLK